MAEQTVPTGQNRLLDLLDRETRKDISPHLKDNGLTAAQVGTCDYITAQKMDSETFVLSVFCDFLQL